MKRKEMANIAMSRFSKNNFIKTIPLMLCYAVADLQYSFKFYQVGKILQYQHNVRKL